jgi:hypothetical protein
MEWEIYRLERLESALGYWFYSEGPRGRIRKVVKFQWMRWAGTSTFNLAFGDSQEGSDYLNDRSVSNNQDRLKVLHTVAMAVIEFLKVHSRAIVVIRANSMARARLYQMMIASIWKEIEQDYEVQGKHASYWMPFVKGLNYSEFIVYKKIV